MRVAAVDIRDAATVLLVSDRPELHVLMLEVEPESGGARDYRDRSGRH